MANKNRRAAISTLIRLDLDWQRQREKFLDWGREPQFPTLADVVVTSLFFLFVWGAAIWLGHADWILGAAVTAIAVLFSFRARGFDEAYRTYLGARARQSHLSASG